MDIKLGYQIYSAREDAEKDLGAVCAKLKEYGYDGVEFAGFYGYTAEQVNEILKKNDLIAVSSHVPYVSIVADMEGTIAFHKAIGCNYIAVPYLDEETRPGAAGFAAAIGLVSVFNGAVNVPLASVFLAVELFGDGGLLYFALACSISYMLSGYNGLYSSQTILYSKLRAMYINVHTNAHHAGGPLGDLPKGNLKD